MFAKLEPIMAKYTKNPDILMQMYITNDVEFMKNFLNYFGKENTFEELYDGFLFKRDNEIDELIKPVEKNVNKYVKRMVRKEKLTEFANRFRNIFSKNKVKALPSGNYQVKKRDLQMNKHQQFTNYYNQNNFPSMVIKDDEKAYILYNDANKVNEQNGNENYEKLLD